LCDITDGHQIAETFRHYAPHIVFHTAAYKHVPLLEEHPYQAVRNNIGGTLRLGQLAKEHDVERFIFVSTDKAARATSVMGASKYLCEKLVLALGENGSGSSMKTAAVRFGNVLGSRGSVVPLFEKQIDQGGPVTITDKRMTRYFMSIPEAALLIVHAACMTHGQDIYLLEMGESMPIIELAERLIRLRGLRPYKDIPIEFTGMRPGEALHEQLLAPDETKQETQHPYISLVVPPPMKTATPDFLREIEDLLDDYLHADARTLKARLVDMARYVRVGTVFVEL
jgi:FlaA1/EpsC-like NDP-sugar epimerase